MNVEIKSQYVGNIYENMIIGINIPYYSVVKTCYVLNNNLYYVIETNSSSFSDKSKAATIYIKRQYDTSFYPDNFVYLDKQIIYDPTLTTNNSGNTISFNLRESPYSLIFYISIEKTTEELRDSKIKEIVNE